MHTLCQAHPLSCMPPAMHPPHATHPLPSTSPATHALCHACPLPPTTHPPTMHTPCHACPHTHALHHASPPLPCKPPPCHACPPLPCMPSTMHTLCHTCFPLWTEFLTHTCENITFLQLHLRTVKKMAAKGDCIDLMFLVPLPTWPLDTLLTRIGQNHSPILLRSVLKTVTANTHEQLLLDLFWATAIF